MNLMQCANAYMAVMGMMEKEWDYATAYALVELKRELYPHVVFYQQEERKLVERYAARDEKGKILWDGNGRFVFREPERAQEYSARRQELGLVEAEGAFQPRRVSRPESIRPAQLEALEGLLVFEQEEGT